MPEESEDLYSKDLYSKDLYSKELYVVGKISGYYGVKGWVKIYSYTDPKENITKYSSLKIKNERSSQKQWQNIKLDAGKLHGKGVIAHFFGFDSREASAQLIDSELAVYRSDFKRSAKNEYYWADLIGLKVINMQALEFGLVERLMETSANDVLVIKTLNDTKDSSEQKEKDKEQKNILIPFVMEHYVKNIDLVAGVITVDWQPDWND